MFDYSSILLNIQGIWGSKFKFWKISVMKLHYLLTVSTIYWTGEETSASVRKWSVILMSKVSNYLTSIFWKLYPRLLYTCKF